MKKLILFGTALFLTNAFVSAQSTYRSAEHSFNVGSTNQTLVRQWNNQYVVSHFITNERSCFACSDFSKFFLPYTPNCFSANAFYSDPLAIEYSVLDMRILDDTVFFCGNKRSSAPPYSYTGFVGYFALQPFILGHFDPVIHEIPATSSLDKLTVYRVGGYSKVAAIGQDSLSTPNEIIIELYRISTPSPIITLHTLPTIPGYTEEIDDVVYTNANVTFVGTLGNNICRFPWLIVMDDLTDFCSSSNYNKIFPFLTSSHEINVHTYSSYLDNGNIAIAYVHDESNRFSTRLRIVDTYASTPSNIVSQEFDIDEKYEPIELTYSDSTNILTLLQPIDITFNTNPQFIFLHPYYSTPYIAPYTFFNNGSLFLSLDSYRKNSIVSVGGKNVYLQSFSFPNIHGCPYEDNRKIDIITDLSASFFPNTISYSNVTSNRFSWNLNTYTTFWSSNCCSD